MHIYHTASVIILARAMKPLPRTEAKTAKWIMCLISLINI